MSTDATSPAQRSPEDAAGGSAGTSAAGAVRAPDDGRTTSSVAGITGPVSQGAHAYASGPGAHPLLLVRHGQTEWSLDGRHTGRTDIPLTEEGEAQARALRDLLAPWDVRAVRVSPLQRARRTAELAGLGDHLELVEDPDLVEWDYGSVEGKSTPQVREELGYEWKIFDHGVAPGRTPGELVQDVAARTAHALARVRPLLDEGPVCLVAHGHSLRILAATYLGLPPSAAAALELSPASLSVLGENHRVPTVRQWNLSPS
ncbi:histidine phosphatase family protein [uncultured Pseudokineococcus sp.]|uniref:histidine phosphatase family protein n=1 Tax=uncultured Pseudokineococcus sp. TaxID=1642928 RepID=UPI0026046C13|nr:histidine phosphatase family protein [uncultured Pseudokineococcus sp.]